MLERQSIRGVTYSFDTIDCHSYWTTAATKSNFKKWVSSTYPDEEYGLECTNEGAFTSDTVLAIEGSSISTIVLTR